MSSGRAAVGIILSALYLIVMALILFHDWPRARQMPLNEWGDFLAGAFAPLAFFWLALGYFQQGDELRQNTEALRLQAEQLKQQVEETKLLVQEAGAQAKASAELAEHQAALLAHEERKGLPQFEPLTVYRENEPHVVLIALRNVGASITSIRLLEARPGLPDSTFTPSELFATSTPARIRFDFGRSPPDTFDFGMVYVDANGIPRTSRFEVRGNHCWLTQHGERWDSPT